MEFAILICSLFAACLGAAVGYAIGFYKHNKGHGINIPDVEVEVPMPEVEPPKEEEQPKGEDEPLLRSASYYRKLAKQADKNGTSDKMILLKKLSKEIDKAANRGWRMLKMDYHEDLNEEIRSSLTKRDIYEYLSKAGYWIEFVYTYNSDPTIDFISWDGRGEELKINEDT